MTSPITQAAVSFLFIHLFICWLIFEACRLDPLLHAPESSKMGSTPINRHWTLITYHNLIPANKKYYYIAEVWKNKYFIIILSTPPPPTSSTTHSVMSLFPIAIKESRINRKKIFFLLFLYDVRNHTQTTLNFDFYCNISPSDSNSCKRMSNYE